MCFKILTNTLTYSQINMTFSDLQNILQNVRKLSIPTFLQFEILLAIKKVLSDHFKTLVDTADSSAKTNVYLPMLVPVKVFVYSLKQVPVISQKKQG